jgi:hypothetical protein
MSRPSVLPSVPENGDVVIGITGSDATLSYVISAVPGPDQFGFVSRADAERPAKACAKRVGVDLWLAENPDVFTLLARFRGSARKGRGHAAAGRAILTGSGR